MSPYRIILIILISAIITFILRALPFIVFNGKIKMPDALERLGKVLPSAIMAVLIVYCLKDVPSDILNTGSPKLLAVLAVVISYRLKKNTFLSIILGTGLYMILITL